MKLKNIIVITIMFCLILLSGCSNSTQETQYSTEETDITSQDENIDDHSTNSLGITFQGGYDEFDRKYIDKVENLWYGMEIVGEEVTEKWVQDVYLKQSPKEQIELPGLYQMIKYFSIPKEDFIELNKSYSDRSISWARIPNDILDALYAEDEKTMKNALVSPLALYYDGMIYTVNELRQMSADEIIRIGIPSEELKNFTNYIDVLIRDHVGDKLYDLNYKNTIDNLRKITDKQ